jgi:hypothetical protein
MKLQFLLIAGLMLAASGCTVHTRTVPASATIETYDPLYYDGYVVYYDEFGTPYYYVDGGVRYVPRTYVGFNVLVGHYHKHRVAYRTWHVREGRHYVHTRRAPGRYHHPRTHRPRVRHHR